MRDAPLRAGPQHEHGHDRAADRAHERADDRCERRVGPARAAAVDVDDPVRRERAEEAGAAAGVKFAEPFRTLTFER